MKRAKGLTLVELLIAVSLAAFVVAVSYGFFNTIERAGTFSEENNRIQSIIVPVYYTLLRDIESADTGYGNINILQNENGKTALEFYTKSCFFFRGICRVRYWLYKNYLIRTEFGLNGLSAEGVETPIVSGITALKVFTSSGNEWHRTAGNVKPSLLKVVLTLKKGGELPLVFKIRSQTYW